MLSVEMLPAMLVYLEYLEGEVFKIQGDASLSPLFFSFHQNVCLVPLFIHTFHF